MGEKYNKFKHRIDFYLEENGVTDLSDYRLGKPAVSSNPKEINIEHWGYTNVPRPTYNILNDLRKNDNFIKHRNKNMFLPKLDFILKLSFPAGVYQNNTKLYVKYKGLPYVWHVTVECGSFISPSELSSKDSELILNKNFTITNIEKIRITHLHCILTPIKDIAIDTKRHVIVLAVVNSNNYDESDNSMQADEPAEEHDLNPSARGQNIIKEEKIIPTVKKNVYQHPEVIIPKKGSSPFKTPPRNKVTKADLEKIIK